MKAVCEADYDHLLLTGLTLEESVVATSLKVSVVSIYLLLHSLYFTFDVTQVGHNRTYNTFNVQNFCCTVKVLIMIEY